MNQARFCGSARTKHAQSCEKPTQTWQARSLQASEKIKNSSDSVQSSCGSCSARNLVAYIAITPVHLSGANGKDDLLVREKLGVMWVRAPQGDKPGLP